jgi:hypothetical protein
MLTEVPYGGGQNIGPNVKKWGEIVSLKSPMRQIAPRRTQSHALLIHMQQKLTVRTNAHKELHRNGLEGEQFAKVEDGGITHGRIGASNPRCGPFERVRRGLSRECGNAVEK